MIFYYISRRLQPAKKFLIATTMIAGFAVSGISAAGAQEHIEARDGEMPWCLS